MTVVFPPMVPVAVLTVPVVILAWTAPELPSVPTGLLRKAFFVALSAIICIPSYYAIQLPGMPWMSLRRISSLILIILLAISITGSANIRLRLYGILTSKKSLLICVMGFYIFAILSLFTSVNVALSLSQLSEYTLSWFFPGLACVIVLRSDGDVRNLMKFIGLLSLVVAAVGLMDYIGQRNFAFDLLPKGLLDQSVETSDFFKRIGATIMRNGRYRAPSIFNVSLSLGEFAAMIAPIGAYFSLHGEQIRERAFGFLVSFSALFSAYLSAVLEAAASVFWCRCRPFWGWLYCGICERTPGA